MKSSQRAAENMFLCMFRITLHNFPLIPSSKSLNSNPLFQTESNALEMSKKAIKSDYSDGRNVVKSGFFLDKTSLCETPMG